jgi:hypothetical protein
MAQDARAVRTWLVRAALVSALLGPAGCVSLDCFSSKPTTPPTGAVCKVVASWVPQVVMSPDPVQNGAIRPYLGAQVFLLSQDLKQLSADGILIVDLYDPTVIDPETKQSKHLERWLFDPDTLKQNYLRHDFWGWGYSLGFPWTTYRPDLTRVEMRAGYLPRSGMMLFGDLSSVTLGGQGDQPVAIQKANVQHGPDLPGVLQTANFQRAPAQPGALQSANLRQ